MAQPSYANNVKIKAHDSLRKDLNMRQWKFCEEYLKCNNATQAYINAGYKPKDRCVARISGSQLLATRNVAAFISRERAAMAKQYQLDKGVLLDHLTQD